LTKGVGRILRLRIASWKTIDSYTNVNGSLLEAISDTVVTHCYVLDVYNPDISSWILDNRRKIIDALEQQEDVFELQEFRKVLLRSMRGWCICLTKGGYVGIACENAQPGDIVAILQDSPVTFVFRSPINPRADCRRLLWWGSVVPYKNHMI
jgi:hypothetical protein